MKHHLLLIAALSLGGCVEAPPTGDVIETAPPLVLEEAVDASNVRTTRLLVPDQQVDPVVLPGSACECETQECLLEWIEATTGCGVCVDLYCGGGRRLGACVPCDE